jgi:hypothetical protein
LERDAKAKCIYKDRRRRRRRFDEIREREEKETRSGETKVVEKDGERGKDQDGNESIRLFDAIQVEVVVLLTPRRLSIRELGRGEGSTKEGNGAQAEAKARDAYG